MRSPLRGFLGQAGWGLADQILSSGTNFAMAIIVARVLGPSGFGSVALAMAMWAGVLSMVRAVIIQPFILRASNLGGEALHVEMASAAGAVTVVGLGFGSLIGLIVVLVGVEGNTGEALIALAAAIVPMLLQDFWRFAGFSTRRADSAFFNDLAWGVVQGLVLLVLWATGGLTAATAIVAWGLGALAGALFGMRQFRVWPKLKTAGRWLRGTVHVGGWFGLASAIHALVAQIILWTIGLGLGAASVGGLRSVQSLYGPIQLVTIAGDSVGLPATSRARLRRGPWGATRVAALVTVFLALAVLVYAIGLGILGHRVLTTVFGSDFAPFSDLLLPVGVSVFAGALATGAALGVRAIEAGRALTVSELVASATGVIAVTALIGPFGLAGASWGLAAASTMRATILWFALGVSVRSRVRQGV